MASIASQPALNLYQLRRSCSTCSLSELCLPMGLAPGDMQRLEVLVTQRGPVNEGEHLFRIGDPLADIYAVRGGYFKSYLVESNGREQVLGFHLPGELIGLDAIWPERHQCNAVALNTGSVCAMPYARVADLSREVPGLQSSMLRLLSKELALSHSLAGDFSAEQRVAGFLLSLSSRLKARGHSPTQLTLAMSRRDIANYLRLATETVSRVISRFEADGLVSVDRREVRLLDMNRLGELGHCFSTGW
ncbi:MAG: helix-turn-helix domain-containing protein [Steroidobacteraceae bacterium]